MNNWIKTLSDINPNITLNNLILPGTHNSSCNNLDNIIDLSNKYYCSTLWPISKIIKNWTITQYYNIYQQLKIGVRVLDIDISYYNNKYYTSHTFIIDELNNLIKQLKDYNRDYGDLYILKIIYRYNIKENQIKELNELFYNNFQNNYVKPEIYNEPLCTSINKIIKNKQNMIIYMNGNIFYNTANIYSDWPNKQSINECDIYNKLKLFNQYYHKKNDNPNLFIDMNWILTPTSNIIIKGLFCCSSYYNLETWIINFNVQLFKFINDNKKNINNINSISLDFITEQLINYIIKINNS